MTDKELTKKLIDIVKHPLFWNEVIDNAGDKPKVKGYAGIEILKDLIEAKVVEGRIEELKHLDSRETWTEYEGIKTVGQRIKELLALKDNKENV